VDHGSYDAGKRVVRFGALQSPETFIQRRYLLLLKEVNTVFFYKEKKDCFRFPFSLNRMREIAMICVYIAIAWAIAI